MAVVIVVGAGGCTHINTLVGGGGHVGDGKVLAGKALEAVLDLAHGADNGAVLVDLLQAQELEDDAVGILIGVLSIPNRNQERQNKT